MWLAWSSIQPAKTFSILEVRLFWFPFFFFLLCKGLRARGEGDDRGWDGWMASLTQWTWVWVNSGSWWWTGRPGVMWFMGLQRVGHYWATDLIWCMFTEVSLSYSISGVQQGDFSYTYTHILFLRLFFIIGYYKIQNMGSCAISQVLVYLFYIFIHSISHSTNDFWPLDM